MPIAYYGKQWAREKGAERASTDLAQTDTSGKDAVCLPAACTGNYGYIVVWETAWI